eukprot:GHVS01019578.1.p1 GENE.GHVS01019578.1~~GHVS01019578.1.p1  ORF type:complete len:403 (+),score=129.22 GHVS01019578.1:382-1590(+)
MLQPLCAPKKERSSTADADRKAFRYLRVVVPLEKGNASSTVDERASTIIINSYLENLGGAASNMSSSQSLQLISAQTEEEDGRSQAVAFGLELWKQAEQAKFREQVQQKEAEYLEAIEKRERQSSCQRQQEFEVKRSELVDLEQQLKAKAKDLQEVVGELHDKEEKFTLEKQMLEGNMQRWKEDCTAAYRRLQAECEQTVKLDRQRYADLAERKSACDVELETMRKRASELEVENFELKKSLFDSPMATLHSDLRIKTFEVDDMKKKLLAVSASKEYYMGYCQQLLKRLKALGDRSWQDEFRTKLSLFRDNISNLQHVVHQHPELFGLVEDAEHASGNITDGGGGGNDVGNGVVVVGNGGVVGNGVVVGNGGVGNSRCVSPIKVKSVMSTQRKGEEVKGRRR